MKKVIQIKESDLIKKIQLLVEQQPESIFDETDYAEVFFHYFRPWIKKNHGDEVSEYPLSFLTKKYLDDFINDYKIRDEIYSSRATMAGIVAVGRALVKKGAHKIKTLRPEKKFTERFKKPLELFIQNLNLPSYINIVFKEDVPYHVNVFFNVDWESLIKSKEVPSNPNQIGKDITNNIQNYLGVTLGNPIHGELQLTLRTHQVDYIGIVEWTKKTLNKDIKKRIKELPNGGAIHRMKFELKSGYAFGGELNLIYRERNWGVRGKVLESVKQLLQEMGYNTEILKVTNN